MRRRVFLVSTGSFLLVGCGDRDGAEPAETPQSATPSPSPRQTSTALPTATAPPAVPTATATARPPHLEPAGFPLDPDTRTGLVTGVFGSRVIRWGAGPTARDYSRDDQPADDAERANACGWNARTHVEYEGQPAVDWYLPAGTPVTATTDGVATLYINTVSNPFDVYGVSRDPYLGNPDRSRAPVSPFPGPGGGQGVFVRIENASYRTDSAHLEVARTIDVVPAHAFLSGYSARFDYGEAFAALRDFRLATPIASWDVTAGELIGFTGDTGYSEGPHLHYAIRPSGSLNALAPTTEPGFENAGWLFRP